MLYDVSRELCPGMVVWPGDQPFEAVTGASIANGDSVNLSSVRLSLHSGTHLDAPWHFDSDAPGVESLGLRVLDMPAFVVDARDLDVITPMHLEAALRASVRAVLLRTDVWPDKASFPDAIPVIHEDVPAVLQAAGIELLGLDLPSVDQIDSKHLPNHHNLWRHGVMILESLDLRAIVAGEYQLTALPLKLAGLDASPVRAILKGPDLK